MLIFVAFSSQSPPKGFHWDIFTNSENKSSIEARNVTDLWMLLLSAVAVIVLVFGSSASKANAIMGVFQQEVKGQCLPRRDPCLG